MGLWCRSREDSLFDARDISIESVYLCYNLVGVAMNSIDRNNALRLRDRPWRRVGSAFLHPGKVKPQRAHIPFILSRII